MADHIVEGKMVPGTSLKEVLVQEPKLISTRFLPCCVFLIQRSFLLGVIQNQLVFSVPGAVEIGSSPVQ